MHIDSYKIWSYDYDFKNKWTTEEMTEIHLNFLKKNNLKPYNYYSEKHQNPLK